MKVYGTNFNCSEILLAKKENQADLIGGPDLAVEDPQVADELLRMFQRESMNQSTYLASAILNQIGDLPGGTKRGHRFAGFAVLKAPDMPIPAANTTAVSPNLS